MRGIETRELGALDCLLNDFACRWRRSGIWRANDDECRRLDTRVAGAKIHVADRFAAADVSRDLRGGEHFSHSLDRLGCALAKAFSEPALHVGVDQRIESFLGHELYAVDPRRL